LRRQLRIAIAVFLLLMAFVFAATLRYRGKASVQLQPQECDAELWKHVYQRERLRVLQECTAVQGRVVSIDRSEDGDLHIGLDPEDKSVLNLINVIHGHRELVVEIVCEHPPVKNSAKTACSGYSSTITVPQAGSRIRVTGSYVTDRDLGWNEIHPVTRIDILQ